MNGFNRAILPNGLRVVSVPLSSVASATVMIIVGAGSRYEHKRINGISHFLEHMAFKGTKSRPSSLIISSVIEGVGGEFNAYTSKDHTAYYIKAAKTHLPLLFDILSDMLLNSLLDKAEINREKGVISEEINMYEDTPFRRIGTIYEELLYGNHPLGWDIAGTKEVITKLKRKDFIDYTSGLYQPNNTVVAVAGGVEHDNVMSLTDKWLGKWKKRPVYHFSKVSDKQNSPAVKVAYKKTEQAHLILGFRSFPREHKDRYVQEVLAAILGGGMSSRMFIEVRERRGLAYYVRSSTTDYEEVGNFESQAGVDLKRINDAVSVMLSEYSKITREEVKDEELTKAKEFLKGRLILEMEDSRNVAGFYGSQLLMESKINTAKQVIEKIEAVTAKNIIRVAKEIFVPKTLNLAVIGPFKDEGRFEKVVNGYK